VRRLRGLGTAALVLLVVAAAALWLVPSDHYLFLPDEAHAVAPIVQVKGEKPDADGGGIYYVDVLVRKATLLERAFPGLRSGSSLVPEHAVRPPGVSEKTRRKIDLSSMARSQDIAAAVALRHLGYKVTSRPQGALVIAVRPGSPADGKLVAGDIIVGVDGKDVKTSQDLRRLIGTHEPGDKVSLTVRDGEGIRTVVTGTERDPSAPKRPIVGIVIQQAAQIDLPIPVKIDAGDVGGPSAGLAFALDVLEELGRKVDRGRKIAATGEIDLDGTVGPIGGVKQKTIGARNSGVDVFLVPAGDNAREARRYAGGLRIVPVHNFRQALRELATATPK
jgi:PDZ domain-containing protein